MVRSLLLACLLPLVFSFVVNSATEKQDVRDGKLLYRGFVVDVSQVQSRSDFSAIETYAKQQLDIVADCGAKPDILAFFRAQPITLQPGIGHGGGFAGPDRGVIVDPTPQSAEKPIFLHELLHMFHFRMLPDGKANPDVLMYYRHARSAQLYPANAYVLKNPPEFFAVTASLYLFGQVARPPYTRANLKSAQPYYYSWLGQLFGVVK